MKTLFKGNAENRKFFIPLLIISIVFGIMLGLLINMQITISDMQILPQSDIDFNKIDENHKSNYFNLALSLQKSINMTANEAIPSVVNITAICEEKYKEKKNNFRYKRINEEYDIVGSGFVISNKGFVATNYHVVENAKNIKVCFLNSDSYKANLYKYDKNTDIAILQIESNKKFKKADLGDSDNINVGDFAIAIGNPYGLEASVNFGIISGIARIKVESSTPVGIFKNYIQTDAPINQGNSGGPLFNIEGKVIGMNTAIYSPSEGSVGIGFALPINTVMIVINELLSKGNFEIGFIGIDYDHSKKIYKDGIEINCIYKNSPAEKLGFELGDKIIEFQEKKIKSGFELDKEYIKYRVGDRILFKVNRNDKILAFTATLEKGKLEGQ